MSNGFLHTWVWRQCSCWSRGQAWEHTNAVNRSNGLHHGLCNRYIESERRHWWQVPQRPSLSSSQSLHWQRAHLSALATWLEKGPVRNGGSAVHWPFSVAGSLITPYQTPGLCHLSPVPITTALKRWRSTWSSSAQHTTRLGGRHGPTKEYLGIHGSCGAFWSGLGRSSAPRPGPEMREWESTGLYFSPLPLETCQPTLRVCIMELWAGWRVNRVDVMAVRVDQCDGWTVAGTDLMSVDVMNEERLHTRTLIDNNASDGALLSGR